MPNRPPGEPLAVPSNPLISHGGPLLTQQDVWLVLWGGWWAGSGPPLCHINPPACLSAGFIGRWVERYLDDIGGSAYLNTVTEECGGSATVGWWQCGGPFGANNHVVRNHFIFRGTYLDSSDPQPVSGFGNDELLRELNEAVAEFARRPGSRWNAQRALIVLLTPPERNHWYAATYCGWNGETPGGLHFVYEILPRPNVPLDCGADRVFGSDPGGRGLLDSVEIGVGLGLARAVTSSGPGLLGEGNAGWHDDRVGDISGKCLVDGQAVLAWPININGVLRAVSPLWSNHVGPDGWCVYESRTTARVVPSSFNFGRITVGRRSVGMPFKYENTGWYELFIGDSSRSPTQGVHLEGDHPGDFRISANNCDRKFLSIDRRYCFVDVRYSPPREALRRGESHAKLRFYSDAGNPASEQTVELKGTPQPAPRLVPDQAPLDFEPTMPGESRQRTVTLTNTGPASVKVSEISTGGSSDFSVPREGDEDCSDGGFPPTSGGLIPRNGKCHVHVTFAPQGAEPETRSGALTIEYNSLESPTTVPLSGRVTTAARLVPSPDRLRFVDPQPLYTSSEPQFVVLRNTGPYGVLVNNVWIEPRGDFASYSTCLGNLVPANEACVVWVVFDPGEVGARSAQLGLSYHSPDGGRTASPTYIELSGTAVDSEAPKMEPRTAELPDTQMGPSGGASQRPLTLTNRSSRSITVGEATIQAGASDFAVGYNQCAHVSPVEPGRSCTVSVTFRPSRLGVRQGRLTVRHRVPDGPDGLTAASLTGRGIGETFVPADPLVPELLLPPGTCSPPNPCELEWAPWG